MKVGDYWFFGTIFCGIPTLSFFPYIIVELNYTHTQAYTHPPTHVWYIDR